ncbi:Protein TIFY like [Actinidia chinensis var. chinensis]|uniref:Protein TIFY n=1 Tax=Actinidia chinensis var. chinensis TaxID=1590841 RepID=A0A2R6P376_ACTCC|nr:Protein TIFY like [Actinidia chinensis var. chinensis]
MLRSAVELDFFQMEKESAGKPQPPKKLFDRRRSLRDIQSVISKMNPEILKSVIATGSVENGNLLASKPKTDEPFLSPALPLLSAPAFGNCVSGTTPLTIFYKGTISVFDVSRNKAENILKLAEENVSKTVDSDLPLTRRKSLERFLQKRKERLTMASPYGNCLPDYAFWGEKKSPYGNWPSDYAFSSEKKSLYGNCPTDYAFLGLKNSSRH